MNSDIVGVTRVAPRFQEELPQAIERLVKVIREENAALRRMDFARAGGLLPAKYAAADALEAAIRAASGSAVADDAIDTLYGEVLDCLSPLMAENQKLHHRSARLQKRVHTMVERLAVRAGNRRSVDAPLGPTTTH